MRTVLFGLDGATYTVLDDLMAKGVMPNLKAFCARGVRAKLLSTPHPITPQAWTTLATGRSMGHHGFADFVQVVMTPQGPMLRFNTGHDIHAEHFWYYASRQGRRATVLNYIGLAPPRELNGHTMPAFVPARHIRRVSYPADLCTRLETVEHCETKLLGLDLDVEKEALQEMPAERWIEWIDHHTKRERAWFAAMRHLMVNEPSDFTGIVFDGVDKIQHLAYRYLDPKHAPKNPTAWESDVIASCHRYFRQIDEFLGETLKLVGDWGRVFIASDHGFTATTEIVYVNKWLEENGYLKWKTETAVDDKESIVVHRLTRHIDLYDWKTTTAFALTPSSNGIFIINVPDAERAAFRAELVKKLYAIKGPDGGQVITDIKLREEKFPGPYMNRAPDLTLTLRDHGFISVLNARDTVVPRSQPSGTHHPDGILLGVGPGLKQGAEVPRVNILDMAPLLVHSIGLEIPAEYEGAFPRSLYQEGYLSSDPPRQHKAAAPAAASTAPVAGDEKMDAQDEAVVIEQLRQLGYIE